MWLPVSPGDSKLSKPSLPKLLAVEMFKPTRNEGVPGWLSQYSMLLLILGHEFEPYIECRHCLQKKKKKKTTPGVSRLKMGQGSFQRWLCKEGRVPSAHNENLLFYQVVSSPSLEASRQTPAGQAVESLLTPQGSGVDSVVRGHCSAQCCLSELQVGAMSKGDSLLLLSVPSEGWHSTRSKQRDNRQTA